MKMEEHLFKNQTYHSGLNGTNFMKSLSRFERWLLSASLVLTIGVISFSFTKSHSANKRSYQVTFVNKYWRNIHLQIRAGNMGIADRNPVKFDGNLGKDQQTTVSYDVLCWYRR